MWRTIFLALSLLSSLVATRALAWDYKGHRVVGSVADRLLTPAAKSHVAQILGFDLRTAGPWADCVKSVVRTVNGTFEYREDPHHPEYEIPCTEFRTTIEQARMEDYVRRNWTQCVYPESGPERGCHNTYHFDDVSEARDRFDRSYKGTNDHDLVAAITAAIAVLKNGTPQGPFSITDKKEALFLLAHFIGDIHQPLHVAAVYLDAHGARVDPDAQATVDPATETAGGNNIFDGHLKLHAQWDAIPADLGEAATQDLVNAAAAVPKTPGSIDYWPVQWASETIQVGHRAFAGLSFAQTAPLRWSVSYNDRDIYLARADKIKREQLAKGGARLAQLLNQIWP
jgi:hypothetical protein